MSVHEILYALSLQCNTLRPGQVWRWRLKWSMAGRLCIRIKYRAMR